MPFIVHPSIFIKWFFIGVQMHWRKIVGSIFIVCCILVVVLIKKSLMSLSSICYSLSLLSRLLYKTQISELIPLSSFFTILFTTETKEHIQSIDEYMNHNTIKNIHFETYLSFFKSCKLNTVEDLTPLLKNSNRISFYLRNNSTRIDWFFGLSTLFLFVFQYKEFWTVFVVCLQIISFWICRQERCVYSWNESTIICIF